MLRGARPRGARPSAAIDDRVHAVARRIAGGSGVYGVNTILFVLFQLLSVPLFLHFWTSSLYGEWLIFYTIPSYLSFIDLGLQTAVGSSMALHVASERFDEAAAELRAYGSALALLVVVTTAACIVGLMGLPITRVLHISTMTRRESVIVGSLMLGYGGLIVLSGITSAGYRSVARFVRQMTFVTGMRGCEYACLVVLLAEHEKPITLAAGLFVSRLIGTLWLFWDFRRTTPWHLELRPANLCILKPLVVPSLGFLGFPLAAVLQNQGMLLVAAAVAPTTVVLLNTTRTLTNSLYQLFAFLGAGATPELSRLLGQGRLEAARDVQRVLARTTLAMATALGAVIVVIGPAVLRAWTSGRVQPAAIALFILTLSALTDCMWSACLPVLASVNSHQAAGFTYAAAAGAALGIACVALPALGLTGVGLSLFTTSICVTVVAVSATGRVLHEPTRRIYASFFASPAQLRRDLHRLARHLRGPRTAPRQAVSH